MRFLKRWFIVGIILSIILFFLIQIIPPDWMWGADEDPLGCGFQIIQSVYAIGPGGLFGFGFLSSRQKHFYLPEPQTDFIFSIICEEFGIVGALFIIVLFTVFIFSSVKIMLSCKDLFAKYLVFGITFQIIIQAVLNLLVVVGLVPVTGVILRGIL